MLAVQLFALHIAVSTICSSSVSSTATDATPSTLQMIHVLFRHGDRTNDKFTVYPKDPYINETYYPTGYGQLTNNGKRREYAIGKSLRTRYNGFLKTTYTPDLLVARCTNFDRTKASLMLVLAGLFPPKMNQIWELGMHWQPIPFSYVEIADDLEFFGMRCANAKNLRDKRFESAEYKSYMEKYANLTAYLQEHSGWTVNSMEKIANLYFCFTTEHEVGLSLPYWAKAIYPSPIVELAPNSYIDYTYTPEMIKFTAGFMLKRILKETMSKINGELPAERKLYLLSGHEINCAFMLRLLGTFYPHIPPYGSHIIFELHQISGVYGYKIFYQDYTSKTPKIQDLPGCGTFCPMEQFINLYQQYLPDENTKCSG